MNLEFYSVGVYGSTEDSFFQKIKENNIDTFLDIRQRRGVRGAKYSYVNSKRLQARLGEMGVRYKHIIDLAPTKEIRELQKEADKQTGIAKRQRNALGQVFRIAYKDRILNKFDLADLVKSLERIGGNKVVLFCVEEAPEACHRSIIAERLEIELGVKTKHL